MSPAISPQLLAFNRLATHIRKHFFEPDLVALRCALACYHAHHSGSDPVWLFIVGPPGSGKTSIIVNSINGLPDVSMESDITPASFLVGKKGGKSILQEGRTSIVLLFKDFTTIISKREEDQREILATLREAYDGFISRKTAESWKKWSGKLTVIAAVTQAIERSWSIHRDLGERFLQVRWANSSDPRALSSKARAQRGEERAISSGMKEIAQAFIEPVLHNVSAEIRPEYGEQIDAIATLVAKLRCHVIRDTQNSRKIIDVGIPEEPSRIGKSLETIACHHATLFNRDLTNEDDIAVALRVGLDSIPSNRLRVIQGMPWDVVPITSPNLMLEASMVRSTIKWQTEELEALGAINVIQNNPVEYILKPEFATLWIDSIAGIIR